ncbi:MAG: peptidylprolyl isomerase [Clostridia bacterium]|nr:peptidylprolyl isomerase [Clostridia bacterium]
MEYDPVFKKQLQSVKDELLTQFAVSKAIERANVTEAEIKAFFDENPAQFMGQETVSASHILVEDEARANELMAKIQSGEVSFEDCAKECSSCPSGQAGGSLGEFGHGQMVPEFDEACFSMEVGELRGPVKTQFGYHIIRLDGKKDAVPMKLAEVHDAIRDHLLADKRRQAYQSKVNQMKIMYPVNR